MIYMCRSMHVYVCMKKIYIFIWSYLESLRQIIDFASNVSILLRVAYTKQNKKILGLISTNKYPTQPVTNKTVQSNPFKDKFYNLENPTDIEW